MFLYRTQVKGIQNWIIGSGKLREIAGGSEIVDGLAGFAETRGMECGATVVQSAAGRTTLRFETVDGVRAFATWWPMAVETRAPGLTVVQAWVETAIHDSASEQRLHDVLTAARLRNSPELPEAGPLLARSGRTGLPAVTRGRDGMLDRASKARHDAFRSGRDRMATLLLSADQTLHFLDDLDGFPAGYLAVIHLDANNVGKRLERGDLDPTMFSRSLSEATLSAAQSAVAVLPSRHGVVAARPIVLGGDDFTIIVPARYALLTAKAYLTAFEAETQRRMAHLGHRPLSACAGIALVKPGWPFLSAHELAEGLCKAAKGAFRESDRSGLVFYRVTTALSADWDEIIRGPLCVGDGEGGRGAALLTQNPYALDRLDRLDRLIEAIGGMPRGALRSWVSAARLDRTRAAEQWERMREITSGSAPDALRQMDAALEGLDCASSTPWSGTAPITTPVFDALEWQHVLEKGSRGSQPDAHNMIGAGR